MKISKIASATIIGAIMTINVYGSSSLDEINSAQKEKSDLIKKLEEASKNGYIDKFQKQKQQIEQEKQQAKEIEKKAEQAQQQAEQAKIEAQKAKIEAQQQAEQAEQAEQAADKKVGEFFTQDGKMIKNLNNEINKAIETNNNLKDLIKQITKEDTKYVGENAIEYIKGDKIQDHILVELLQDSDGEKNNQKIAILENLKNIGILKKEVFNEYNKLFQDEDIGTTEDETLSKKRMKELAEKFKEIIGENNTNGLRKLYFIINKIDKNMLAEEFKQVEYAQKELKDKENALQQKQKEITEQTNRIIAQEQEIKKQQQEIKKQEQLVKQAQEKLEQAEQELKEAEELAKAVKDPEAKAKIIAELDAKLNQAKKERAEAISSDKNLELNKDEAQTVLSLLSVTNNEEVNNLLLKTEAEDIAILAKNINNSLEEVSKEFKDNKTVDTLLSSVGSAINSRLAKLSNPLNDDLALAYAIKNLSDNKFADNGDTLSSVVKEYTNRFNYDSNLW
ncbi:hypothetical protein, partial [Campylobacter pinnipediorum]|uniref:hypothetical protein n=1 Tax=Campylobacter pinnipediorum TaxID=1965231 RepID=UPI00112FB50A